MGSEIYAYFPVEAPAAKSDELAELAADSGLADVPGSGDEAQVVARLAPESEVREGSKARLALDTTKVHLFHPSDGSNSSSRGCWATTRGARRQRRGRRGCRPAGRH